MNCVLFLLFFIYHMKYKCTSINIGAAFKGMHVSPAKHCYVWLLDRHTNRQTDAGQSYPYVPLCSQATQKPKLPSLDTLRKSGYHWQSYGSWHNAFENIYIGKWSRWSECCVTWTLIIPTQRLRRGYCNAPVVPSVSVSVTLWPCEHDRNSTFVKSIKSNALFKEGYSISPRLFFLEALS